MSQSDRKQMKLSDDSQQWVDFYNQKENQFLALIEKHYHETMGSFSAQLHDFVRLCFTIDHKNRPTCRQLLSHALFSGQDSMRKPTRGNKQLFELTKLHIPDLIEYVDLQMNEKANKK